MGELVGGADGRARFAHVPEGDGGERESAGAARADRLRAAIRKLLERDRDGGLTRQRLWDGLPDDLRRNEKAFRDALEDGVGRDWAKQERATRLGGPLYRPGGEV